MGLTSVCITSPGSSVRPFPLLAAVGARTKRIEIGTAVIDMRYENPLYMAEDAGAADIIAGGRLQLGISRGSPEQVIDGWRYFGYAPEEGKTDADMARRHTEVLLEVLRGEGFARPNPRPMFPNPSGLLRVEPYSEGLRDRILVCTNATAEWAAKLGMNLQSSTLKIDESGRPFHVQQAEQIRIYRDAWKAAGHARVPRMSVSRSIFALVDDRDRAYFGRGDEDGDTIGYLGGNERAIFGRSYAAEPDVLIEQLKTDEAIAEADTLLLTVPATNSASTGTPTSSSPFLTCGPGPRLALTLTLCSCWPRRPLPGFDLAGGDDGLGAALDAELLQDGGDVRLHRRLRDTEFVGDLLIEQAARQHHQHPHLLWRQRRKPRDHRSGLGIGAAPQIDIGRRPHAALQHARDSLAQHLDAERLGNEAGSAEIHAAADHGGIVIGRNDDDRQA